MHNRGFISLPVLTLVLVILGLLSVGVFGYLQMHPSVDEQQSSQSLTTQAVSDFRTTPTSGSVPLTVTFTASGKNGDYKTVDFGDGSAVSQMDLLRGCEGSGMNPCTYVVDHTYTSVGTYEAKYYSSCAECGRAQHAVPLATATVVATKLSDQTPSKTLPFTLSYGTAVITLRPGEAAAESSGDFVIQLISLKSNEVDIKVSGRDRNVSGRNSQELILKNGEEGFFLNFYPVGLYITPSVKNDGSVTLSLVEQSTD